MNEMLKEHFKHSDSIIIRNGKKSLSLTKELMEDLDCVMSLDSATEIKKLLEYEGEGWVEAFEKRTGWNL